MNGDERGEWTYVGGNGESVIDYAVVNGEAWNEIEKFEVGERMESDHMPITVRLTARGLTEKKKKKKEKKSEWREVWNEEEREKYKEKMEKEVWEGESIEEKIKDMLGKMKKATSMKKKKEGQRAVQQWWNGECVKKKNEVKEALRRWRRGEGNKEEIKKKRVEFRRECEKRKEIRKKEEEEEIMKVKNEKEVWSYINKERKKWDRGGEEIELGEWRKHFMNLLNKRENEKEGGERYGGVESWDREEEEEISMMEIEWQIGRMKKGKAAGMDGVKNEAWMYGGENVKDRLKVILNEVWKGGLVPDEWKEGIIIPVFKKGSKEDIANYRGITLLNTICRVYAGVLAERLNEEI